MSLNLLPILETLSVVDKAGLITPFTPYESQREIISTVEADFAAQKPSRIIILKARQLGCSTAIEAILFSLAILFQNTNAVVVSHERDSSEYLFSMTKFFYESWPYREHFPHRYSSKYQMSFDEHGSNIWVQTAGKKKAGRSRTIRVAHFSEAAFYSFPHEVMGAFNQSMPYLPGTLQIVESTANGIGNWYHEEWLKAEAGEEGSFTPLFFPWWKHPEYIPCQGQGCHDESCDECVKQARGVKPRDQDEQELVRLYGLSPARLAWRRWAIQARTYGNIDLFKQEFPSTPNEAFVASGFNVFSDTWLSRCYKPLKPGVGRLEVRENGRVEFVADPRGPLRMFRQPSSDQNWGQYFVGADPCYGSMKGDYAAAQVINRNNHEQVAVWHGRVNPNDFADELAKLGTFYNLATIAPELEGPGVATLARLTTIYPRIWQYKKVDRWPGLNNTNSLGWSSSWRTKIWAVTKLAQYLERDDVIIHDLQTYRELQNYTYFENGSWGTFGGAGEIHDDLVSSLAICLTAESMETPTDAFEEPKTGTHGDDVGPEPWE